MNVLIETTRGIHFGGRAMLLGDDDRECAWAEQWIRHDPDLKWILGNYVEADNANSNGHIFPLEDLKEAQATIANKPLNMLHQARRIVGNYVAVEMLYPVEGASAGANPHIEALSCFYRYYFPEEFKAVEAAQAEGAIFYSMEAVPASLTCAVDDCGQEFAYRGRAHDSYCAHLKEPVAARRLNRPHFKGGALIIPPVLPGWKGADIKEITALIERDAEDAETLYEAFKQQGPHLESSQWEAAMVAVLRMIEEDKEFPAGKRDKLAKKGQALPDGSFPIENVADLKNAIQAIGRAKNPAAAKAHIKRRAKALGATNLIPSGW